MSAQADIRRWFLKKPDHDKSKKDPAKVESAPASDKAGGTADKLASKTPYKKESKFFAGGNGADGTSTNGDKTKLKVEKKSPDGGKRKSDQGVENLVSKEEKTSPKKPRLVIPANEDEEIGRSKSKKPTAEVSEIHPEKKEKKTPAKSRARGRVVDEDSEEEIEDEEPPARTPARGRGRGKTAVVDDEEEEDTFKTPQSVGTGRGKSPTNVATKFPEKKSKTPVAAGGRGRGATPGEANDDKPSSGRGRGRGGGGGGGGLPPWMQPRGVPPHKGEKEVPQGAENALAGLTFVISGTLDSLEREEAEVLIKSHGGRVTGSVSKKTDYLLADEDVGGAKSKKAKELGVKFLTEDGLFAMIIASKPKQAQKGPAKSSPMKTVGQSAASPVQTSGSSVPVNSAKKGVLAGKLPQGKSGTAAQDSESWPNKHRPKTTADLIGNPGIVKQLKEWLQNWDTTFLHPVNKGMKGKKRGAGGSSSDDKKAVLLSGTPGIGKTSTARLVCEELGFETLEVNASDSRGKADSKIRAGMGGSTANTIKEMVNNESISFNQRKSPKSVLIMDEVDGMSGGDRGGVADLILSIKSSRIPIICICNDKYSQKLKSLTNYCLPLAYRKPTKQQMAKRLLQIAKAEGLHVDEVTLEEIAQRTNGDMRMALNQLQYMSLRTRTLKFAEVRSRMLASSKDEDISPFSAADKLLGFDGGSLRMDERVDLHMSDMDLVPLLVQENYLNFVPAAANQDQSGVRLMNLAARAALSIAEGDIVNVQIRRRQQWQHAQMGAFMSSIIPAALMHGRRMEFEGGRNFNRFPAWLGKNSAFGKKVRLLEDVHIHLLASRTCEPTREAIRMGYVPLLSLILSYPLRHSPKEVAVEEVVRIMEEYSITQDDYDTMMDISKFKGQPDLRDGVPPAVKTALTKYYKQGQQDRVVRSADLLPALALPGQRKASKKPARLKLVEEAVDGDLDKEGEADDMEEEEEEEAADEEDKLDSLLNSNGATKVSVNFDKRKGTNGQRGGVKSKASDTKAPNKTGGNSAGKRKR
ncbi:unnamed protein product [Calypogeia fissa]